MPSTECSKETMTLFFFSSAFFVLFFKHVIWFRFGKLESVYIIQDTLYFLEAMCIVLRKRCHIYAFLTEHLKFQEQTSSCTKTVGKYCQIKKKLESGHFTLWKRYIQDSPLTKRNHRFFRRAPRISRITNFYTWNMGD